MACEWLHANEIAMQIENVELNMNNNKMNKW